LAPPLLREEQARKKLVVVDAPQNGLLLPYAAMPEEVNLSFGVRGHDL